MEILIAAPDPEMRRFIFHEEGLHRLSLLGNIHWLEKGQDLAKALGDIDIVLTTWGSPRFDQPVIIGAPHLKLLGHCAGTVVPYTVPELFSSGVRVVNSNRALAHCTAEFAMAAILAGVWRFKEYGHVLQNGGWSNSREKMPMGLHEAVVGIVGVGTVSRLLIKLLQPFECRLLISDEYLSEKDAEALGGKLVSLEDLCRQSDVVSIHHTLTDKTRGLFGAKQFSLMKDDALLVNTARGPIIDNSALLEAAKEGRIYISLDVYEKEPVSPDSVTLAGYDKVSCTPHIGGHCSGWHNHMFGDVIDEVEHFINGEALTQEVTPELYRRQSFY